MLRIVKIVKARDKDGTNGFEVKLDVNEKKTLSIEEMDEYDMSNIKDELTLLHKYRRGACCVDVVIKEKGKLIIRECLRTADDIFDLLERCDDIYILVIHGYEGHDCIYVKEEVEVDDETYDRLYGYYVVDKMRTRSLRFDL